MSVSEEAVSLAFRDRHRFKSGFLPRDFRSSQTIARSISMTSRDHHKE